MTQALVKTKEKDSVEWPKEFDSALKLMIMLLCQLFSSDKGGVVARSDVFCKSRFP